MYQNGKKAKNEALIKFVAPVDLKDSLQQLAKERNIAIFSLLRLIASEYVKRKPAAHGHGESPGGKAFALLNSVRDRPMMNVDSGGCEFFISGGKTWQIHRRSNQ